MLGGAVLRRGGEGRPRSIPDLPNVRRIPAWGSPLGKFVGFFLDESWSNVLGVGTLFASLVLRKIAPCVWFFTIGTLDHMKQTRPLPAEGLTRMLETTECRGEL